MAKKVFLSLALLCAPLFVCASLLEGVVSLYPKISLGGAYAGSSFKRFAAQVPYKSGAAQLEAPLYVLLPNNFYLESNYFIRADYNKNLREDSFYTSNFSKANITFKNDLLTFKAGRQSYTPQGKEFVIYYGDGILRDNAAPTALDAITHTLATRYFAYDLLLGREVKKLSLNNDDSLVYGGNVMFSLGEAFSVDAFYYGRQTEYTIWSALISDDFTHHNRHFGIYGGGINIKIAGQTQFSLYAAKNSGAYKVNMPMLEIESRYSSYAFNGRITTKSENDFGQSEYRLNMFYGSAGASPKRAYTPISQNIDMGFVYGGGNLRQYTSAGGYHMMHTAQSPESFYFFIPSLSYNITPDIWPALNFGAGIYMFSHTSDVPLKEIGTEIDLKISYNNGPFSLNILYGLFMPGQGYIDPYEDAPETTGKAINKIGVFTSYEFSF